MNTQETFPQDANYSFLLNVDGNEVKVTYKRSAYGDCFDAEKQKEAIAPSLVHYTFLGRAVSETSYRSHYTYIDAIESVGGCPYEFARLVAEQLYDEQKSRNPEAFSNQLNLFHS